MVPVLQNLSRASRYSWIGTGTIAKRNIEGWHRYCKNKAGTDFINTDARRGCINLWIRVFLDRRSVTYPLPELKLAVITSLFSEILFFIGHSRYFTATSHRLHCQDLLGTAMLRFARAIKTTELKAKQSINWLRTLYTGCLKFKNSFRIIRYRGLK